MDTYLFFVLPLIGFVGMFSGGYWGVGCGWLIVPTMLIFGFTPNEAVGVGLLQIVPSILPSIRKDVRALDWSKGGIASKLVIPLAAGVFLFAFSGKFINKFFYVRFGSLPLLITFCVFMIFLAVIVLFGEANENEDNIPSVTNKHSMTAFLVGAVTGIFSSVLGIGGALFFRPALINYFKIPENITSKAVRILLFIATFTGGMFYAFSGGTPDYKILGLSLVIAIGGIIGFPLGIRVHNIIVKNGYSKYINKSFAVVTLIVLTNTLLNIFGYIMFSRYLMIAIAVLLFFSINLFKEYTNRHKL
ncbi:MAG: sulfite exporter TauE/SafE family protein [Endomicrobiaceae bacterium]